MARNKNWGYRDSPSTVSAMHRIDWMGQGRVGRRLSQHRGSRTRFTVSALVALTFAGASITSLVSSPSAKADTLQMSSDSNETGWYPNEPQLAPSAVTSGDFGELFDTQLTGQLYAQPLISQPTVLAVTEDDNAYGLNSSTGTIEWQRNFGTQADPLAQTSCGDI